MTAPTDNPYGLDEIFNKEFLVLVEPYVAEDERTRKRRKYIGDEETIKRISQALQTKIEAMLDYVIGEDDVLLQSGEKNRIHTIKNELRAEQRKRKAELNSERSK